MYQKHLPPKTNVHPPAFIYTSPTYATYLGTWLTYYPSRNR